MIEYYSLLLILLAWLIALSGTAIALSMLRHFSVMDKPNERSNHKKVTPRGGGIAIVFTMLLFAFVCNLEINVILSLLLLACVSFIDDMKNISVRWRLLAQILAVLITLPALHGRISPEYIPILLEYAAVTLAWLWFINLTNFMDGIDGITSLQTIAMAIGISLMAVILPALPPFVPLYASIIAAATLGFFWFNRHPAHIFMGDIGSISLGFMMFFLLATLAASGGFFAALILPAYYLYDATSTLLRRLLRGDKIWQAHSEHAYQKAVRRGLSHTQVVRKITLLNISLIALALLSTQGTVMGISALLLAYATTALLVRHLATSANQK